MALQSFQKRNLQVAIESTEGTAETLDPSTDSVIIQAGTSSITGEVAELARDQAKFSNRPFVYGRERGNIQGQIELIGSGTAGNAAPIGKILQICGMAETLTASTSSAYNTITDGIESATLGFDHAGLFKTLVGCRGNLTGLAFDVGSFLLANVDLTGFVSSDADRAIPGTVDVSAFSTPPVIRHDNAVFTIGTDDLEATSFGLDFGNSVPYIEHTEGQRILIADRRATFTATFFAPAKATFDVYDLRRANTPLAIQAQVGATPGRTTIDLVSAQIETVQETDVQGFKAYTIGGRILQDAGDDDIEFTFD